MKPKLIYIVATHLAHPGLTHKFLGQLDAFRDYFDAKLHYFDYQKTDSVFRKLWAYFLFELLSVMHILRHRIIYVRYDPKAVITNLCLCLFSKNRKIILEHNAIFEFSLAALNRHWEQKLHSIWLRIFRYCSIIHAGVSEEVQSHLISVGISPTLTVSIQNGFDPLDRTASTDNHSILDQIRAFKTCFKKIGVFVGNGYTWHGVDAVISALSKRNDCGLVVVGPYPTQLNGTTVFYAGAHPIETVMAIYELCDFGIGSFNLSLKHRSKVSLLKVVEYLCNGLPVLVNSDECAADIADIRPYIFDYHKDPKNLDAIMAFSETKETVKQVSLSALSWRQHLLPVIRLFQSINRTRIVIAMFTGIGNGVLTLPFLQSIKHQLPHVELTVLCEKNKGVDELISEVGLADRIIYEPDRVCYDFYIQSIVGGNKKAALILKRRHWGMRVICQQYTDYPSPIKDRLFDLLLRAQPVGCHSEQHESVQYFSFLPALGGHIPTPIPTVRMDHYFQKKQARRLPDTLPSRYCIIQLGAAFNIPDAKLYPLDYWKAVIAQLSHHQSVLLVGSGSEEYLGSELTRQINTDRILNLIGKTSIGELMDLISEATFVLGVDSSVAHISGLLNQKTMVLWGPTHFKKSHQLGNNTHFLTLHQPCSPCRGPERMGLYNGPNAIRYCSYNIRCMQELRPELVLNKLKALRWI